MKFTLKKNVLCLNVLTLKSILWELNCTKRWQWLDTWTSQKNLVATTSSLWFLKNTSGTTYLKKSFRMYVRVALKENWLGWIKRLVTLWYVLVQENVNAIYGLKKIKLSLILGSHVMLVILTIRCHEDSDSNAIEKCCSCFQFEGPELAVE